jgi:hypothetical protein
MQTQPQPRIPTIPRKPDSLRSIPCLALAVLLCAEAAAGTAIPPQPRILEYRIAWNGLPAAGATVSITPSQVAGVSGYVVEATARTNAVVDLFWTFRGQARSTFVAAPDGDGLTPLHFVYDRTMAGRPYVTWIDFDADGRGARSVYIKGTRRREMAVEGDELLDPITAVFRARLSGAKPGDRMRYDVWTGESRYRVDLAVEGLERIEVPAGHYEALRVVPSVWKVTGAAKLDPRLRGATIWVANDPGRTLLRLRGEVFVGAITLDLITLEPPA